MIGDIAALVLICLQAVGAAQGWHGVVHTPAGDAAAAARVHVKALKAGSPEFEAMADTKGVFQFPALASGAYRVSVDWQGQHAVGARPIALPSTQIALLTISAGGDLTVALETVMQRLKHGRRATFRAEGF